MEQLELALAAQKKHVEDASTRCLEAERQLFVVTKNLTRFAETLDDLILAKETIAELDREK